MREGRRTATTGRPCRGVPALVAAAHVRRCSRRLCGRWWRCRDRGLTRRCCRRFGLARAGNQHQADNRQRGTQYDYFFHSVNCFVYKPIRRKSRWQMYYDGISSQN